MQPAAMMQQILGNTLQKVVVEQDEKFKENNPYDRWELPDLQYVEVTDVIQRNQVYGIFFGAHWSGPCFGWASILQSLKHELNNEYPGFIELIFVPMLKKYRDLDKREDQKEQMHEFLKVWDGSLYMPIEEEFNIMQLKDKYQIVEIPQFVVIDKNATLITKEGLKEFLKLPSRPQDIMKRWTDHLKKDGQQQF